MADSDTPVGSRLDVDVEKEDEAPSVHSISASSITDQTHGDSDGESEAAAGGLGSPSRVLTMTERGDIEVYPVASNDPQNEKYTGRRSLRAITRTSTKSSWKDPGPPPDGGLKAWTQVLMGHLVIMNTWGFINSFGVFQAYYVTLLDRPPSDISWIGSVQVFLLFFIGTFTGRLTDAGYFRETFLVGTLLSVLGMMMASLSTQYWQLFLAQGVCCGIGNGCLFCPALSLTSTYFSKKRSLAIGLAACGSATGGLIFPAMVQQLLPKVGFGWTMRALGFLDLGCLVICNVFIRQRLPPRKAGPIVEWNAFKEAPYTLFAVAMFFNFWGVYFAFYYLGAFARTTIGLPYTDSINLILVLNGVGFVGRILPNYLADAYFGPMNCLIPVCAASAMIMYCMIAVTSPTGLYVWSVAYGILGAAIQSLFPAVLSSLTTDLSKAGVRMGMMFSIVSFAVLTGPPIAGLLIQKMDGGYAYAQCFAASSLALGTILSLGARFSKSGAMLRVKM